MALKNFTLNEANRADIEAWLQDISDEVNALINELDDEVDVAGWLDCLDDRIDSARLDISGRIQDIANGSIENEPEDEDEDE